MHAYIFPQCISAPKIVCAPIRFIEYVSMVAALHRTDALMPRTRPRCIGLMHSDAQCRTFRPEKYFTCIHTSEIINA
jgi:hypothetical protein